MKIHDQLIKETLSKELQLILFLLENKIENGEVNNEILRNIDWDLFIQLAVHHRVFPTLYKKLNRMDNIEVPPKVINLLKRHYQMNVFRMLQLSGETDYIEHCFTKHDIRTLFLKGPLLAEHLYGEISLRTCADLDILIPIDKLEKAEEILLSKGYIKDDYIQTILNDWKWRHHHITFYHPEKKIKVEIHWRLNPGPAKEPSFNELWKRRATIPFSNRMLSVLGEEDLFLFLVTHGARHGWSRLRWLLDIKYLAEKIVDWKKIKNRLQKYHYLQIGGQALILLSSLLNIETSKDMKLLMRKKRSHQLALEALFYIRQMVNLHTEPIPDHISIYHRQHLFSLMSVHQKYIFLLSFLFPYPEDAKMLPLPKYFHFLYFLLRPFLCLLRWSRKQAV